MIDTVLVPVDASERSTHALEYALEVHPDATITALHIVDPRNFYPATSIEGGITAGYDQMRTNYERQAQKILDDARETAAARGGEIETDWISGEVPRSIVKYVSEHDIDQIVMGSHGRSGASRILLGSVAETVTRRSPVPVTIVR